MNKSLIDHLNRLNPTGIKWSEMTDDQKDELQAVWKSVVSDPHNLACTCPRTFCRNNRNCKFCVSTHRFYGSLPDCLRIVDDNMSVGVPPEKRYNPHNTMNPRSTLARDRTDYANEVAERTSESPDPDRIKKNIETWHALVRVPENVACKCPNTDCWYHDNCVKCIALHRYYDGFPRCCQPIHDKIDEAVQTYKKEEAGE